VKKQQFERAYNEACMVLAKITAALGMDEAVEKATNTEEATAVVLAAIANASRGQALAQVGEFAAQAANGHLSALVDLERDFSVRCMTVMRELMAHAEPVDNEAQDCFIPAAAYAAFVNAHAELLRVKKNGSGPSEPSS
jgi:hypothetical protein